MSNVDIGGDEEMPYIEAGRRKQFDSIVDKLVQVMPVGFDPGELNYCISRLLWSLWEKHSRYYTGNDLIGVLECVKQEFYRRKMVPYEEIKKCLNGDITEVGVV